MSFIIIWKPKTYELLPSRAVVVTVISLSTVAPFRSRQSRKGGSLFSVDRVGMACRQSKNRVCRDTVDDRVSTTALLPSVTDRQKAAHMSPPCKMHRWSQKLKSLSCAKNKLVYDSPRSLTDDP